jgi:Arc/MetJ-type ribon-helix-helix transcriptional regulator
MNELPIDIAARIEGFVSSGYGAAEDVLREALSALEYRDAGIAAIQEGIAGEQAGRQGARPAMATLRAKHGLADE